MAQTSATVSDRSHAIGLHFSGSVSPLSFDFDCGGAFGLPLQFAGVRAAVQHDSQPARFRACRFDAPRTYVADGAADSFTVQLRPKDK